MMLTEATLSTKVSLEVKQVKLDHLLLQYWYDSKSQHRKILYIFFIGRKNVEALNYQKNTESIRNTERVIFNLEITVLKQMLTNNNATYCSDPSWKYSFSTWNSILCITLLQQ